MARIPQPRAADFQLRNAPLVAAPRGVDVAPLQQLGRAMLDRGLAQAAADARREGVRAQAEARDGQLVKRDSGFFGFFDKAFDEGAKYYFTRQKQIQVDDVISAVAAEHPNDPRAFREVVELRRDEIFDGVPADVLPGVRLYYDRQRAGADRRLATSAMEQENERAKSQFLLDYQTLTKKGEIEVERTGELSPETAASFARMREQSAAMAFMPLQRDALEVASRNKLDIANLVHQYNSLETVGERTAFFNSLLTEDGPLAGRPYTERGEIVNHISTLQRAHKAAMSATKSALFSRANEIIQIEEDGNRAAGVEAVQAGLAALVPLFPEAAEKLDEVSGAVRLRQKTAQAYVMPDRLLTANIADLEARSRGPGFDTVAQGQELDAYRRAKVAQDKLWGTGQVIDFVERHNLEEYFEREGWADMTREQRVSLLERHFAATAKLEDGREIITRFMPVLYYTEAELDDVVNQWRNGNPTDRLNVLNTIAMEVPKHRVDLVVQHLSRDEPGLAGVVELFASPRTERQVLGRRIMQGREFLESPGAGDLRDELSKVEEVFAGRFRGLLPRDRTGATVSAYTEMALHLYTDMRRSTNKFDRPSETEITQVINAIADGEIWTTPNGEPAFPLREGLTLMQSRDLWHGLTDDFLRGQLGGNLPVDHPDPSLMNEFDAERIIEDAVPIRTREGRFNLVLPARPGGNLLGEDIIWLKDRRTGLNYELDPAELQPRPATPTAPGAFGGDILAP